jgi:C-terminal processing protease CtpA/Prc
MFQDNARGPIVGWRTNGAGGSNSLNIARFQVGAYSEGDTGVTLSLMVRAQPIVTDDFGTTAYVENVGVRPDIPVDYMTLDNLLSGGKAFVQAFTDAIVKQIQGN